MVAEPAPPPASVGRAGSRGAEGKVPMGATEAKVSIGGGDMEGKVPMGGETKSAEAKTPIGGRKNKNKKKIVLEF